MGAVVFAREIVETEFAVGSSSEASFCASPKIAPAAGEAKRSSTAPALIFCRLPDAVSICSDASLSARTDPAFK